MRRTRSHASQIVRLEEEFVALAMKGLHLPLKRQLQDMTALA